MTHLGITENLSVKDLDETALKNASYLYIEGYLVSSPTAFEAALTAQRIAKQAGVAVSLTLSDMTMVENFRAEFDTLIDRGVDLLFCNEDEARICTQSNNREDMVRILDQRVSSFALTCGGDGAYVAGHNQPPSFIKASRVNPVDTTGAGDSFNAGYLAARLNGREPVAAAAIAHRIAGEVVMHHGAIIAREAMPEVEL